MKLPAFTGWNWNLMLALSFFAGVIFLLANFSERLSFPYDYRMFDDDGNENLVPNQPIAQKFIALRNNLDQINLNLGNLEKIQTGEKLTVSLLDAGCKKTLRTATHQFPSHAPKQFDHFSFDLIPDSVGQQYCLQILYEAKEKRKSVPFVRKKKATGESNDSFTNQITGKVYPEETLIFRPAYRETSWQATLAELNRRMSAYKANWLQGNPLFFIFGFFLATTILLVLVLILRQEEQD